MTGQLHAQTITGPALVVDGKTIDMTGTVIMLAYIDAPEAKQTCERNGATWACGAEAAENLAAIVGTAPVNCAIIGAAEHGIPLAICENDTFDLGREMVRRGLAMAPDSAPEEYIAAASIAHQQSSGLWNAAYQPFADWRADNPKAVTRVVQTQAETRSPRSAPSTQPLSGKRYTGALGCAIKGNRSIRGDWIYHLPGQVYYDATRPQDLFCTEREAQAAGYRRSKE